MTDLRGVSAIVTTPFNQDGTVDLDGVETIIRKHIREGCSSVTLFGLASEFYKLTDEERREIRDRSIQACAGEPIQTVVSVTHHATPVATEHARQAELAGADYLMILPPFFLKPSSVDVYSHVQRVAAAVDLPVVVQYAPGPTNMKIQPELFADLAGSVDTVDYFKIEATPPGTYISSLLEMTDGSVDVFVGNAGLGMLEAFDRGAVGVMPGSPLSDIYVEIVDTYDRGDKAEATKVYNRLLPMLNHITQSAEMAFYYGKHILERRGVINSPETRDPSFTPDEYHDARFEACYNDLADHFTELNVW